MTQGAVNRQARCLDGFCRALWPVKTVNFSKGSDIIRL